jgi:hypothetical protein
MMHPDTVIRTVDDAIGVGVFATRRIPRGTITWVRDPLDIILSPHDVAQLDPLRRAVVDRYAWREEGVGWILCWDHARFVNHSCDANCIGLGVDYEIALRDIEEGEELTDDYRSLGVFEDPFRCLCGAKHCTGDVRTGPDDLLAMRWRRRWDRARVDVARVPQPLGAFVRPARAG